MLEVDRAIDLSAKGYCLERKQASCESEVWERQRGVLADQGAIWTQHLWRQSDASTDSRCGAKVLARRTRRLTILVAALQQTFTTEVKT